MTATTCARACHPLLLGMLVDRRAEGRGGRHEHLRLRSRGRVRPRCTRLPRQNECASSRCAQGLSIVDNPVYTNAVPRLALTNLRNYTGITRRIRRPRSTASPAPLGNGGGLRGCPATTRLRGASSAPSRRCHWPLTPDGPAAERSTLHILNTFDINAGLIRETGPDKPVSGSPVEHGQQPHGGRYAYRTINDPTTSSTSPRRLQLGAASRCPTPSPGRSSRDPRADAASARLDGRRDRSDRRRRRRNRHSAR